jgi:hypothetical protein
MSYFHHVVYRSIVCTLRVVQYLNQDIKYFFATYLTRRTEKVLHLLNSLSGACNNFCEKISMYMLLGGELLLVPLQMDILQGPHSHRPPILPAALPLSPRYYRIRSGGRICAFTWVILICKFEIYRDQSRI